MNFGTIQRYASKREVVTKADALSARLTDSTFRLGWELGKTSFRAKVTGGHAARV